MTSSKQDEGPVARRLLPYDAARSELGGIGRTTLWRLVQDGHIDQVRIGRRAMIVSDSIDRYIASQARA